MAESNPNRALVQLPERSTLYVGLGGRIMVREAIGEGYALHTPIDEQGNPLGRPFITSPPIPDEFLHDMDTEPSAKDGAEATS